MASWKRICCPIDFSNESWFAMEEAAHLAWRLGADLALVNVRDPTSPLRPPSGVIALPGAVERRLLATQRRASEWAGAAERIVSSPVGFSLVSGDPVEEIVRFADEGRFDVIVMGTRDRPERPPKPNNSIASAVVQGAPCSVVVARPTVNRKDLRTA
jgi:nucleotide-binding universal stress UspA family protein